MKALLLLAVLAAPAHAGHACAETSEVLGHRHCTPYGAWGALARFPSITFDTEMFREHFATPPLSTTPVAGVFATTTEAAPDATAWGVRLRIGAPLQFRPLYLAFELDIGGLSSPTTPSYALLSQAVAALGAHAHVTQSIMLSAELSGAQRGVYGRSHRSRGSRNESDHVRRSDIHRRLRGPPARVRRVFLLRHVAC